MDESRRSFFKTVIATALFPSLPMMYTTEPCLVIRSVPVPVAKRRKLKGVWSFDVPSSHPLPEEVEYLAESILKSEDDFVRRKMK